MGSENSDDNELKAKCASVINLLADTSLGFGMATSRMGDKKIHPALTELKQKLDAGGDAMALLRRPEATEILIAWCKHTDNKHPDLSTHPEKKQLWETFLLATSVIDELSNARAEDKPLQTEEKPGAQSAGWNKREKSVTARREIISAPAVDRKTIAADPAAARDLM